MISKLAGLSIRIAAHSSILLSLAVTAAFVRTFVIANELSHASRAADR